MDEMFELFDNELLIPDNAFHHVANRNDTNELFSEVWWRITSRPSVCFWHEADVPLVLTNVCFEG